VILDVFDIISLSSHIASWFHTDSLHSFFIIFLPVLRVPTLIFLVHRYHHEEACLDTSFADTNTV